MLWTRPLILMLLLTLSSVAEAGDPFSFQRLFLIEDNACDFIPPYGAFGSGDHLSLWEDEGSVGEIGYAAQRTNAVQGSGILRIEGELEVRKDFSGGCVYSAVAVSIESNALVRITASALGDRGGWSSENQILWFSVYENLGLFEQRLVAKTDFPVQAATVSFSESLDVPPGSYSVSLGAFALGDSQQAKFEAFDLAVETLPEPTHGALASLGAICLLARRVGQRRL